jgi:chromosome segregation ATPase
MSFIKCFTLGCALGLFTVCFVPCAGAQVSKPSEPAQGDRDQTLQQLLVEVRELRLALQRTTIINARFQMLIERLKAQQAQVDSINQQLESVRSNLTKLRAAKTQAVAQMKETEERLNNLSGEERTTLEKTTKEVKQWLESKGVEEQQQIQEEVDLTMRLQVAQARLSDLDNQLDALMKELKGP